MKAILEFDLNDLDDRMAHLRCVKAEDMALALWEIRYNLKKRLQFRIEDKEFEDQHQLLDKCLELIQDEFDNNNILIDDLIR